MHIRVPDENLVSRGQMMIMKEEEGPARAPELYRQETSPDGAEAELAAQFSCSVLKGRESRASVSGTTNHAIQDHVLSTDGKNVSDKKQICICLDIYMFMYFI